MIKSIIITFLIGLLDHMVFHSMWYHTLIVCWTLFGSLLYADFKRVTRGKLNVHWTTDIIVGIFTVLLGPLNLFI